MTLQTLEHRFRLLEEQHRILEQARAVLGQILESGARKAYQEADGEWYLAPIPPHWLVEFDQWEKQFAVAKAGLMFDLLIAASEGDPEQVLRLKRAKLGFFQFVQGWAEKQEPVVIYWQRALADWLAWALPHEAITDEEFDTFWRGPWAERMELADD